MPSEISNSDYPLEKAMLVLISLNPIDLSRVLALLQLDISALMGLTGAVFKEWLGTSWGIFSATILLILWDIIPLWLALKVFKRKDL